MFPESRQGDHSLSRAVALVLNAASRSECGSLVRSLTAQWPASGWQPPEAARREGGLWLIPASALEEVSHATAVSGERQTPFQQFYEKPPSAQPPQSHPAASARCSSGDRPRLDGCLPRIRCSGGGSLPAAAATLLGARMCCVLEGARLWPAAEQRWGSRGFLERGLAGVRCHVLSCRMDQRRFSYLFDARQMGRVDGGYHTEPLVQTVQMSIGDFFAQSARREACLYLQHSLLQDTGAGAAPCAGLGDQMLQDIAGGLNRPLLDACAAAGRFGTWVRCQLFIGAEAAAGARSILHFDQYDNLFVQIAGTKRFRIFDPAQSASLYSYPVHHPLDTRSQIDLKEWAGPDIQPGGHAPAHAAGSAGFPRAGGAAGTELLLKPGEVLFLPAYWWHEVTTLDPGGADSGLCVSVNFWFSAARMLLQPDFPLWPAMRLELARQLEYLISDSLADRAQHVPAFFRAIDRQIRQQCGAREHGSVAWPALHAERPADVAPREWEGLFEFVVWKACLLLGPRGVGPFLVEFCDPGRFAALRSAGGR